MLQISRRSFLKRMGLTAGTLTAREWFRLLGPVQAKGAAGPQKGMLIDTTQCLGCNMCVEACRKRWGLEGDSEPDGLSPTSYVAIKATETQNGETLFVRQSCMHCIDPACASVCPVGALKKEPYGPVKYDASLCLGCRYCFIACPFGVPRYTWDDPAPVLSKCIFCYDRLKDGEQPACAEACPTGATLFGDREELLAIARERIKSNPDRYVDHIYGENEVGGTSLLFLSSVPFAELGFPTDVGTDPLPDRTWQVMSKIPGIVVGMAAFLGISYKLTKDGRIGVSRDPAPQRDSDQQDDGGDRK